MTASLLRPQIQVTESLTPLSQSATGIAGEATAAFANTYNIGPVIPTFCSSWSTFTTLYGNFSVANGNPLHFAVYSYFANGGTGCWVLRVPNSDAETASVITNDIEGGGGEPLATWSAVNPGAWGNEIYISMTAVSTGHVNLYVYNGGTAQSNIVEQWLNVSANPVDPRYAPNIINSPAPAGSNYVNVALAYDGGSYIAGETDFGPLSVTQLAGGSDGSTAPDLGGTTTQMFDQYVQQQIININLPGEQLVADINTLVSWAAGREDVLVFADGPTPNLPESSAAVVQNYVNLVSGGSSISPSSFVAVYGPYLLIQDPSSTVLGATRYIGPCGSVLGDVAQTDLLAGPQQSPAGTVYGQIAAVALEAAFAPTDLDTLAEYNVNAIKAVPGSGFCVFGARTLEMGYPSMYVAVRRVLMKIEHDCVALVQPYLFAPNGPNLWSAISTVLNNYFNVQTLAGLFSTTDVTQAYIVTCDSTNNTSVQAQSGIVNIEIAVALGSPAEYILINVQQVNGTTTVTSSAATS